MMSGSARSGALRLRGAKRYFGEWDAADPVSWAILRVVSAQNDLAHAISGVACYGAPERMIEAAIVERREAIAALVKALEREPRGIPINYSAGAIA